MSLHIFAQSLSKGECAVIFSGVSRDFLTGFRSSDGTLPFPILIDKNERNEENKKIGKEFTLVND